MICLAGLLQLLRNVGVLRICEALVLIPVKAIDKKNFVVVASCLNENIVVFNSMIYYSALSFLCSFQKKKKKKEDSTVASNFRSR